MKALTVQQPWAWAIVHGGKDVENRTQAWTYRGPLAIHAGARWSDRGGMSRLVIGAAYDVLAGVAGVRLDHREELIDESVERGGLRAIDEPFVSGIIGTVDLVDVHVAERPGCCDSEWAESSYAEHAGRTRRDVVHLVLEHPRPLTEPIPCRGRLGLWTPPADVLTQLAEAISA